MFAPESGDLVGQCLGPRTLEFLPLLGADEAGLDDRERQEARQHGTSAGAHERQGHACRGDHLQDAADIDKYLHAVKDSDAGDQDLIEIIPQRGREPEDLDRVLEADQDQAQREHAAELLGDRREDEVRMCERNRAGRTLEQAHAEPAGRADREQALKDLVTGARGILPRVAPDLHAHAHMREDPVCGDRRQRAGTEARERIMRLLRRDIEDQQIRQEIDQCASEIAAENEDADIDRDDGRGLNDLLPGGVLREHARGEKAHEDLHELGGLQRDADARQRQFRSVLGAAEHEDRRERQGPDAADQPAEALGQVPERAHERRQDQAGHARRGNDHELAQIIVRVQPRLDDKADGQEHADVIRDERRRARVDDPPEHEIDRQERRFDHIQKQHDRTHRLHEQHEVSEQMKHEKEEPLAPRHAAARRVGLCPEIGQSKDRVTEDQKDQYELGINCDEVIQYPAFLRRSCAFESSFSMFSFFIWVAASSCFSS